MAFVYYDDIVELDDETVESLPDIIRNSPRGEAAGGLINNKQKRSHENNEKHQHRKQSGPQLGRNRFIEKSRS